MKILLWPTMYFPNIGGLEKMVHSLAVALDKKGHQLLVITNAFKTETITIEGIKIFTFPFLSALFKYDLLMIKKILHQLSTIFNHFSPDVVNIHGWFECFCFYQIRLLEKHSVPLCLTVHGLLEQKYYDTENCLKLWQRAQAVNTVSKAVVSPFAHSCIQTIYNGLPISNKPLQKLPKNRLLLFGRLTKEKCFHIAFRAVKLLMPKYPDLKLTLLGDGPDYEKLAKLRHTLQLFVDMPGFIPPSEVQEYIDQSTIILVPSSYESFSLSSLEAALRGRPVIASNVFGLKETIENHKTGLLVEPNNVKAFAEAIDTLLSQPNQIEQMGNAAFTRALTIFTIDKTCNNYLRMYEQAISLHNYSCS